MVLDARARRDGDRARGDAIARCFLLEAELFESGWHTEFEGEVAGIIGAGAFVAFGRFEGMLPVRRLRGDWWELDELETMLVGAQSGNVLRLGDPVVVQVERVDAPRGARGPLPGRGLLELIRSVAARGFIAPTG